MARRGSITALGQIAEAIALVSQGQPGHIVDTLIAERGQKIVRYATDCDSGHAAAIPRRKITESPVLIAVEVASLNRFPVG